MISLCFMFLKFSLIFFFWSAESTLGRYGNELVSDKPKVNNNSDKIAIWGRKMPILERYCNVLIRNVKF